MLCKAMLFVVLSASGLLQEASELAELKNEFLRGNDSTRPGTLLKIFELSPDEGEEPSRDVTYVLTLGLRDKNIEIKTTTVRLLGQRQHPDVAVPALIKLLKSLRKDIPKIDKQEYKSHKDQIHGDDLGVALLHLVMVGSKSTDYGTTLIESLGNYRDRRACKALIDFTKGLKVSRKPTWPAETACKVLASYGTKTSLETVIKSVDRIEQAMTGNKKGKEKAGFSMLQKMKIAILENLETAVKAADLPIAEVRTAKAWKTWFKLYGKELPKELVPCNPDS